MAALQIISTSWPIAFMWACFMGGGVVIYIVTSLTSKTRVEYNVIDERTRTLENAFQSLVRAQEKQVALLEKRG